MKYIIEQMYAFIAQHDTAEGICAIQMGSAWMPMVAADMKRVAQLTPAAQTMADETGKVITLCKFETRTELQVITPGVKQ